MGELTQKALKERLHYNPETGIFIRIARAGNQMVGSKVGYTCKKDGYIRIGVNGQRYLAHRLAWLYMTGEFPSHQIDHKKHIRDDNRWSEIQEATHQENGKNTSLQTNNTSGSLGVFPRTDGKAWCASIKVNGKPLHLGSFSTKEAAIKRRELASVLYGFHKNHGAAAWEA